MKLVVALFPALLQETLTRKLNLPKVTKETFSSDASASAFIENQLNLSELPQLLENPEVELWIGYQQAEWEIAETLAGGKTFSTAESIWKKKAQELLDFQKKQRGRIRLFDIRQAEIRASAFAEHIGQECSGTAGTAISYPMNVYLPLACQGVRQSNHITTLATELFASSIRLSDEETPTLNLQNYVDHYRTLLETERTLQSSRQEVELLLLQLQQTQEEMEGLYSSNLENQKALTKHTERASELAEENELLKAQLRNLQLELESYYNTSKHLDEKVRKVQDLNEALKSQTNECLYKEFVLQHTLDSMKDSYLLKSLMLVQRLGRIFNPFAKAAYKREQRTLHDAHLLSRSSYFDAQWYSRKYSDVKNSGMNPFKHFLHFGAKEGRNPSAAFDSKKYVERYPDVSSSGINPLLHYIKFGEQEGRSVSATSLTLNRKQ